jgi:hypothetical protein
VVKLKQDVENFAGEETQIEQQVESHDIWAFFFWFEEDGKTN